MVDLDQFKSVNDALAKIDAARHSYLRAGRAVLERGDAAILSTREGIFWSAGLTRCQGLHDATAREIRHENPHAVYPLLRAFAETVLHLIYVIDHPAYIDRLVRRERDRPKNAPGRKTIQALVAYASKQAAGMKGVYAELSEATHFGSIAVWASWSQDGEADHGRTGFVWSSRPRWRSEEQQLTACAYLLELADVGEILLANFAGRYLG